MLHIKNKKVIQVVLVILISVLLLYYGIDMIMKQKSHGLPAGVTGIIILCYLTKKKRIQMIIASFSILFAIIAAIYLNYFK